MEKWYESKKIDSGVVISSRIRLARNLSNFKFSLKLDKLESQKLLDTLREAIINERNPLSQVLEFKNVYKMNDEDKKALVERHIISPTLAVKQSPCGVILKDDETMSIMLNEEDHLRIQTIMPSNNLKAAWDLADKLDTLIEENLNYAFDNELGYLTSCPSNTGTGLRASLMLHLPAHRQSRQIEAMTDSLAKFGITIRGIYGEGTKSLGSMYQISNQITLGLTEEETIENLEHIANQIIENELFMQNEYIKMSKDEFEDRIFRAYGILKYSRIMQAAEAIELLSNLRLGIIHGFIDKKKIKKTLYNLIMDVQDSNIILKARNDNYDGYRDVYRSKYIRACIEK